ncbi:type II and III secretion system protein family protein [Novosphingobium sp.]|uniref:type II and III secretion system protein family protein n=1 Tax=Novosphingobium sp. TaxID=1874826 RepID=UPI00286DE674|nr:type II and III secretion system protein family protein [Novosphingobium sp.]
MTTPALHHPAAISRDKTMKRLLTTLLTAACVSVPLALTPAGTVQAQSVTRAVQDIPLSIGRGQLINVPGRMADVFVADDKVADVQIKSASQLYLMGKSGGTTTVYASNAAGQIIWSANVRVNSGLDSVDQMLHLAMPDAKIGVNTFGTDTVLLTGTVAAPEDAAEAKRLVEAFMGKANVITRLKTATPLQVNLQVRFAEVSRSLVRAIGGNLVTKDSTGGFKFGVQSGRQGALTVTQSVPATATSPAIPGSVTFNGANGKTLLGGFGKFLGLDLGAAFDLAERDGLITTLANPNLTALSGETADFLAGGEYPIPISQGLGTTSVEYKRFGVSLAYTPTVLANGRISLRVRPEVSELSSEGAVTLNGFQIPALTIRRAETTVELGSGQSFMIAGLMSNNAQSTIDKAPGAGDIPILGNLFRSSEFRKGQTELVIVVTPYLVHPVNANDIKLPTDGFQAANLGQQLLGNIQSDGQTGGDRPKPSQVPDANVAPKVGELLEPEQPANKAKKTSKPKTADAGSDARPGFSLN